MKNIIYTLLFTITPVIVCCQIPAKDIEHLPRSFNLENPFPIIYSPKCKSRYGTKIFIGTIEQQSTSGPCGVYCTAGTMKIKVAKKKYIYALIPCYSDSIDRRGKKVKITTTCLSKDRDIGCYKFARNTIDSKGQAFLYCEHLTYIDQ